MASNLLTNIYKSVQILRIKERNGHIFIAFDPTARMCKRVCFDGRILLFFCPGILQRSIAPTGQGRKNDRSFFEKN